MSLRRRSSPLAELLAVLAPTLAFACQEATKPPSTSGYASSGRGSTLPTGCSGTRAPDDGGATGHAGEPDVDTCGNELLEEGEECDGDLLRDGCVSVGFAGGILRCARDCRYDTAECVGSERCGDGRDNDGDGDADCGDADCSEACSSSCAVPERVADPSVVEASSEGHPNELEASCASDLGSGPELVYSIEATESGVLEVSVDGGLFAVEIASSCDAPTPRACGFGEASAEVRQGETLFVVVDALENARGGPFTLRVRSRRTGVCGDGYRDANEPCEDGNAQTGDGCDANCTVEATETEDNGEPEVADALSQPFFAEIAPEGDVDYVVVEVSSGPATLAASTLNFDDGACAKNEMDSFLELLDGDGVTVLGTDDDGGDGLCARLVVGGLTTGTYYLGVRASGLGTTPTFPYRLAVELD